MDSVLFQMFQSMCLVNQNQTKNEKKKTIKIVCLLRIRCGISVIGPNNVSSHKQDDKQQ